MSRLSMRRTLIAVTVGAGVFLGSTASNAAGTVSGHAAGQSYMFSFAHDCKATLYSSGFPQSGVGTVTVGTNVYGPVNSVQADASGYACGSTHGSAPLVFLRWQTTPEGTGVLTCQGHGSYTTANAVGGIRVVKFTATLPCTRPKAAPFTAHAAITFDVLPVHNPFGLGVYSATLN